MFSATTCETGWCARPLLRFSGSFFHFCRASIGQDPDHPPPNFSRKTQFLCQGTLGRWEQGLLEVEMIFSRPFRPYFVDFDIAYFEFLINLKFKYSNIYQNN